MSSPSLARTANVALGLALGSISCLAVPALTLLALRLLPLPMTPLSGIGAGAVLVLVMLAGPPLAIAAVVTAHVAWHRSRPGTDSRQLSIAALALGYSSTIFAGGFVALAVYVVWSVASQPWFTF